MSTAVPKLNTGDSQTDLWADAVAANVNRMSGQLKQYPKLKPLDVGATDEQMRVRLNELLTRLQG